MPEAVQAVLARMMQPILDIWHVVLGYMVADRFKDALSFRVVDSAQRDGFIMSAELLAFPLGFAEEQDSAQQVVDDIRTSFGHLRSSYEQCFVSNASLAARGEHMVDYLADKMAHMIRSFNLPRPS